MKPNFNARAEEDHCIDHFRSHCSASGKDILINSLIDLCRLLRLPGLCGKLEPLRQDAEPCQVFHAQPSQSNPPHKRLERESRGFLCFRDYFQAGLCWKCYDPSLAKKLTVFLPMNPGPPLTKILIQSVVFDSPASLRGTSSTSVYGFGDNDLKTEAGRTSPIGPYAPAKLESEERTPVLTAISSSLIGCPCDAVTMGDTHRPFIAHNREEMRIINVGSCGIPRDQGDLLAFATYDA